ncbi:hypothetical protein LZ198_07430 [Myxococcus sp. K15C18031901]|uniref:hypothetical protein n=1 Tax=Myxococcus dinghuensis TaxID=2906761 RepID=UPI0020A792E0|nr:hypothetical protein [Myxococcus dinghuensis]MCP3098707.1 hypothetical protein [Myxococcus dinghuensis]
MHPRRRRLLIVLLALGTVGGYASGFASLSRHRHCHGGWREHWGSRWNGPPSGAFDESGTAPTSPAPPASAACEAPLPSQSPAALAGAR